MWGARAPTNTTLGVPCSQSTPLQPPRPPAARGARARSARALPRAPRATADSVIDEVEGRPKRTTFAKGSSAWRQENSQSSWNANQADGEDGKDYLYELGRQSANMNIDMGAKNSTGMVDTLFTGDYLGRDADITSGELRKYELRTLKHLEGDYHVPAAFIDKVALHLTKNTLMDQGLFTGKCPLILGIWGKKGCGKSFMLELACREMGVEPIIMSAGELEDEWAGEPGLLIRNRYRKAAEVIKNWGKMSCLIINDIDAGLGWFDNSQCTVNNQMVTGTLMNLCDNPNVVSVGQDWREDEHVARVPIIVTANDLNTLYAPILRDGRMEKFYWDPSREDLLQMVHTMFKDDGYSLDDMRHLMAVHSEQPLDFFGALRARMYDSAILEWTKDISEDRFNGALRDLARVKYHPSRERLHTDIAEFKGEAIDMSLDRLMQQAEELAQEQQHVLDHSLARDYLRWQEEYVPPEKEAPTAEMLQEAERLREEMQAKHMQRVREAEERGREARAKREAEEAALEAYYLEHPEERPEPEPEPEVFERRWPEVRPDVAREVLMGENNFTLVDIRATRDFNTETAKGAVSVPAVLKTGRPLAWELAPNEDFIANLQAAFPDKESRLVLMSAGNREEYEQAGPEYFDAMYDELVEAGYEDIVVVKGGYRNWLNYWMPNGKKRPPEGNYKTDQASSGTMCVGSDIAPIDKARREV